MHVVRTLLAFFLLGSSLTACNRATPSIIDRTLLDSPGSVPTLPANSWLGTQLLGVGGASFGVSGALARAADGSLFQVGVSGHSIEGQPVTGTQDAVVTKYTAGGSRLWTRMIGGASGASVYPKTAATDPSGNLYFAGGVSGNFDGHSASGLQDGFLVKYDPSGNRLWSRTISASGGTFEYRGLAVDALGNVFAAGSAVGDADGHTHAGTTDLFLVKYDPFGNKVWSVQFGEPGVGVNGTSLVLAGTDIAVAAVASGSIAGEPFSGAVASGLILTFDNLGNQLGAKMFGAVGADTAAYFIARDGAGNLYVSGTTTDGFDGQPHSGGTTDAFVTSYTGGLTHRWTQTFGPGAGAGTVPLGFAADPAGNTFIAGYSDGPLFGQTPPGTLAPLVASYSALGTLRFGVLAGDAGSVALHNGVVADGAGACYVSGVLVGGTYGGFAGAGAADALLANFAADGSLQYHLFIGEKEEARAAPRDPDFFR